MRIRSKTASVANKLFISAAAVWGISYQAGLYSGRLDLSVFRMFTELSNAACAAYFALCAAILLFSHERDAGDSPFVCIKGLCTMCISLTGIIAAVALMHTINFTSSEGISMFVLHVATPAATIADWLLFDKKGRLSQWMPAVWTSAPLAYFVYIMISAAADPHMAKRFPYPFLDCETLGIPLYLFCIGTITALYVLFGFVLQYGDLILHIRSSSKPHKSAV